VTVQRVFKSPGTKLLRLTVDLEAGVVRSLSMRGDFFAHPEEGFDRVEASLAGVPVGAFEATFRSALEREGVSLYGLDPADVARLIEEAAHDA
jgi:hypothetical protein